jgi:hypothetical protein
MQKWMTAWALPDSTRIRPPYDDVIDVLRSMISIVPVDEPWYWIEYPEFAHSAPETRDETATDHFRKHGYFRGFRPFAEGWQSLPQPVPFLDLVAQFHLVPVRGRLFVEIERDRFLAIVRQQLDLIAVDEAWYREAYPDAAGHIAAGRYDSAKGHYVATGYFDGYLPADVDVDEPWYVSRYAHVRTGLAEGAASSAKDHYLRIGYGEGCRARENCTS